MSDEAVAEFAAMTNATPEQARVYLNLSDNNFANAVTLFFESPDLAASTTQPTPSAPATSSNRAPHGAADDIIDVDSAEDDDFMDTSGGGGADVESDEALARRLQQEDYGGGSGGGGDDGVRAPIARTSETLVGGGPVWASDDLHDEVMAQMQARQQRHGYGGPAGIFNQRQRDTSSRVWDAENGDPAERQNALANVTGGASSSSNKSSMLAELFRPPFELMWHQGWDQARDEGKENSKWLLVNIQDPSIFDCQALNRDIWKNASVRETVKENFIFLQFAKDDPRGQTYMQYYFHDMKDIDDAYPHIAIVDPRTGEQVKVWSGRPVPSADEFVHQLHEFLDRYSLDVDAKNPVAKRKAEQRKERDLGRLTEEEMLELAMRNSLGGENADSSKQAADDPDALTHSVGNLKGKEKEGGSGGGASAIETDVPETPFSRISDTSPHEEPPTGPETTRIQFRHSGGRVVRRFGLQEHVRRLYEWLKAAPLEGKGGVEFELIFMGRNLMEALDQTIEEAGLKNGSVMVEFLAVEE
ncbi:hypothetical protein K402DRAFT_392624 [Aulographum hederae CBS 113979]|uniref:UBX domain-containing protein n=1 Tax=Aulographum hederae CBS 113979 TaxID=1176131 RepID=A0A6G1H498_9PEZI|nr:hypothetical protein K402DRAFT_392624 [Aulographum hederae CBS 113979]